MQKIPQYAHRLEVPLIADSVDSPVLRYGRRMTAIEFATQDGQWGRVTFEKLDSIKASRGEHEPFPYAPDEASGYSWVKTISKSEWLRERYEYEKRYYGKNYNFGGDVDEMLDEYSHYIFSFHDEFIEAIAAGIWFDVYDTNLADCDFNPSHPLRGISHLDCTERFESSGITCLVRRNPLSFDEIEHAAKLCSQTILDIGADLGGGTSGDWILTRRVKDGIGKSYLRGYFGHAVEVYEGIPSLAEIRPHIEKWLSEVRERRRKMGKV